MRTFKTKPKTHLFSALSVFPIADCKVTAVPLAFFTSNSIVWYCVVSRDVERHPHDPSSTLVHFDQTRTVQFIIYGEL